MIEFVYDSPGCLISGTVETIEVPGMGKLRIWRFYEQGKLRTVYF